MKMKIFINKMLLVAAVLAVTMQNCTFKEEIDTDPNNPKEAPINALLTPAELLVAYTWGGNMSRYNGMFTQQLEGDDRQALTIYNYTFQRSDTDDPWDNLYRAMLNCRDIINLAGITSPYYSGVAKVLMANSLGSLTSMYGDVPFSEALKGDKQIIQPKFDNQEQIYVTIQTLLSEAITELGTPNTGAAPGVDDIIFNGNRSRWIATAHALKARYYLHTAKRNASAYTDAIASAQAALTATFPGFKLTFDGTSATTQAPWYQWRTQRDDIIPNAFMFNKMNAIADPRIPRYFGVTTAGGFNGRFGTYLQGTTGPVVMMYPSELYFILAESYLAQGNNADAETNLVMGVNTSYSEVGVTGTFTTAGVDLQTIMEQKYYSTYLIPESLVDWRRTGFPVLSPVSGTAVPRRYPYPQKEKNYNGGNVPDEGTIPYLFRMWIDP